MNYYELLDGADVWFHCKIYDSLLIIVFEIGIADNHQACASL